MAKAAGFKGVGGWALTDNPSSIAECRGFVRGSKTATDQIEIIEPKQSSSFNVKAVMSVPRLGFMDNHFCAMDAFVPLRMELLKVTGAYWGQQLERGIQTQIDKGADAVLTLDYDTVFKKDDVVELIRLMYENPEVDAIVPIQVGRKGKTALMTVRTKSGARMEQVKREYFEGDLSPIATGHFGLTLLRTSSLLKMPHPWFHASPNRDGQWYDGRVDADIAFWHKFRETGLRAYCANRVVLGHLELMCPWPTENMGTMYQCPDDFWDVGKPAEVWK